MPDPYNLQRFLSAQAPVIEQVRAELRAGRKRGRVPDKSDEGSVLGFGKLAETAKDKYFVGSDRFAPKAAVH